MVSARMGAKLSRGVPSYHIFCTLASWTVRQPLKPRKPFNKTSRCPWFFMISYDFWYFRTLWRAPNSSLSAIMPRPGHARFALPSVCKGLRPNSKCRRLDMPRTLCHFRFGTLWNEIKCQILGLWLSDFLRLFPNFAVFTRMYDAWSPRMESCHVISCFL